MGTVIATVERERDFGRLELLLSCDHLRFSNQNLLHITIINLTQMSPNTYAITSYKKALDALFTLADLPVTRGYLLAHDKCSKSIQVVSMLG